MKPKALQKGDTIRLKREVAKTQVCPEDRENHETAQIQSFLECQGGIFTDRDLKGCRYWNVEDVELVQDNA